VNISEILPYPEADAAPGDARRRLWDDDGLHFSPEGSRTLGRSLAPLIAPLLRGSFEHAAKPRHDPDEHDSGEEADKVDDLDSLV
jgi:hypothetical protein